MCLYDLWFVPINISSNGNTFSIILILDDNIRDIESYGLKNIVKCRSWIGFTKEEYDICIIFAWNHAKSIIEKWPHKGKKLVVPFPSLYTIDT